ncbi:Lsr2 family protein [Planomonospora sp. ID91781]|uniref:histone-like nucleoid-structuring protein Lsr2 n=1 Tax=Planomonospora TaxID=1998 RepID=UPI001670467F|nr:MULTISPECIES: Lsr2 family protein [Planomonospora]MBG0825988.1 Lsr2 family protein [Planomonospora sp. ID91781]GGL41057.1 Lsr2 family protein [Planomonospora parontospora subsp. antibiotica]GII17919.1 Lsr2 family protein [Planomonospora parontospora subsp. antibiotica]
MAKQIQEILIDDLDGGEATQTVSFAIDGTSYEIDLSDVNAKKLREHLAPFVASARRDLSAGAPKRRRGGATRALSREKSADIRAWAKQHGHPVSERGRIASKIVEQYEAAH